MYVAWIGRRGRALLARLPVQWKEGDVRSTDLRIAYQSLKSPVDFSELFPDRTRFLSRCGSFYRQHNLVCSGRKGCKALDSYKGWNGAPFFEPAGPPRFSRPKGRVKILRDRKLCYSTEVETPSGVMPEPLLHFPDFVL
jgi:hypothetical protein